MELILTILANNSVFIAAAIVMIVAFILFFTLITSFLGKNALRSRIGMATKQPSSPRTRDQEAELKKNIQYRKNAGKAQDFVQYFNLVRLVDEALTKGRLVQAGYRGPRPFTIFLVFRALLPIGTILLSVIYLFYLTDLDFSFFVKVIMCLTAGVIGYYLPDVWLRNVISKRQQNISRATSECLDFMLIMVESGMSIEAALQSVAHEISYISEPLAEELAITTAELSYLQPRRKALENMSTRIGLDIYKSLSTALIQADRHGASVGQTLRIISQENRNNIISYIERKGAALPPKMVIPMMLFLVPAIFVVMLAPSLPDLAVLIE